MQSAYGGFEGFRRFTEPKLDMRSGSDAASIYSRVSGRTVGAARAAQTAKEMGTAVKMVDRLLEQLGFFKEGDELPPIVDWFKNDYGFCAIDPDKNILARSLVEGIKAMPQELRNTVTELDLSGLELSCIHPVLAHFTNLKKLNLTNNAISSFGNTLFVNLQELYLGQNRIEKATGVECFPGLEALDLNRNQLSNFGDFWVLLSGESCPAAPQLKRIDLSSNRFKGNCIGFPTFTKLTELRLSGNQLTSLHGLDELLQLERLYADSNRLVELGTLPSLDHAWKAFSVKNNPDLEHTLTEEESTFIKEMRVAMTTPERGNRGPLMFAKQVSSRSVFERNYARDVSRVAAKSTRYLLGQEQKRAGKEEELKALKERSPHVVRRFQEIAAKARARVQRRKEAADKPPTKVSHKKLPQKTKTRRKSALPSVGRTPQPPKGRRGGRRRSHDMRPSRVKEIRAIAKKGQEVIMHAVGGKRSLGGKKADGGVGVVKSTSVKVRRGGRRTAFLQTSGQMPVQQ